MQFNNFSCPGPKEKNQDYLMPPLKTEKGIFAAIADGVGGTYGGEIASEIAIKTITEIIVNDKFSNMEELFNRVASALTLRSSDDESLSKMATTLSILHISNEIASVGHVGDTRVYHLRANGIMRRTKDQTELQELIDQGVFTKQQAKRYPRKNVILSSLNPLGNHHFDCQTFEVEDKDRFILMTDGAYSFFNLVEVRDLSVSNSDIDSLSDQIQKTITNSGAKDDYSCISLEI